MYGAKEEDQPTQVKRVIVLVRSVYPDLKWFRHRVRDPNVDDDQVWFFWLPDKPGDVQISAGEGDSFVVETDKHDERFKSLSGAQIAGKVIEWLALPGGHVDYSWHPK